MIAGVTHYYDHLWISLSLLDMDINIFPDDRCKKIQLEIVREKNSLYQRIHLPSFDGEFCNGKIKNFRTPEVLEELQSVTINNSNYNQVLILEVSNSDYYTLFNNSTIHKVYYDLKYGIIGFDYTINNIE